MLNMINENKDFCIAFVKNNSLGERLIYLPLYVTTKQGGVCKRRGHFR
jgi:hypothetical protein